MLVQSDSPEYRAACKLWDLYLRTKNEFVQRGEYEDDDEDVYDVQDNPIGSTEDEVKLTDNKLRDIPSRLLPLILDISLVYSYYYTAWRGTVKQLSYICKQTYRNALTVDNCFILGRTPSMLPINYSVGCA